MERTKTVESGANEKPLWKKVGGGSFRLGNRLIKRGETFAAYQVDIPPAFRDTVIRLTEGTEVPAVQAPVIQDAVVPVYTLQSRNGSSWYDVIDANGKPVNEKAMQKKAAEQLIESLTQ